MRDATAACLPLVAPRPGQLAVNLLDACGAPGGGPAWITAVVSSARRPTACDPFEPHIPPAVPWSVRLAWVRYGLLASFFDSTDPTKMPLPPDMRRHPALERAWRNLMSARALEGEHMMEFRREFAKSYANLADPLAQPEPTPRGRRGYPAFRVAIHESINLFRELYQVQPTRTERGPTCRFVAVALAGLEGSWYWQAANEFDQSSDPRSLLILTLYSLRKVVVPASIADAIRFCLAQPSKAASGPPPKDGAVAGYFWRRGRGGENRYRIA